MLVIASALSFELASADAARALRVRRPSQQIARTVVRETRVAWLQSRLYLFHRLGPDRLTIPQFVRFNRTGRYPLRAWVAAKQHLRALIERSVSAERRQSSFRASGPPRAVAVSLRLVPTVPDVLGDIRGGWQIFKAEMWDRVARFYARSRRLNYGDLRHEVERRR